MKLKAFLEENGVYRKESSCWCLEFKDLRQWTKLFVSSLNFLLGDSIPHRIENVKMNLQPTLNQTIILTEEI